MRTDIVCAPYPEDRKWVWFVQEVGVVCKASNRLLSDASIGGHNEYWGHVTLQCSVEE